MLARYNKFIAAILGAIASTISVVADGEVSQNDIFAIATAWVAAFAVYQVANKRTTEG